MDLIVEPEINTSTAAPPVFQQPWFIDIAKASSRFHQLETKRDGLVVGVLPYIVHRTNLGLRRGRDPFFARYGGPKITVPELLGREERLEVYNDLVSQLPRGLSFFFQCPTHVPDADLVREAFLEHSFKREDRHTRSQHPGQNGIFFADASDELGIRRNTQGNGGQPKARGQVLENSPLVTSKKTADRTREQLRSAEGKLDVVLVKDAAEFIRFYMQNLKGPPEYPMPIAEELIREGLNRQQIKIYVARQKQKQQDNAVPLWDAAAAVAFDGQRAYHWMHSVRSGTDEDRPDPGAMKLLIAHEIRDAQKLNLTFDSDGEYGNTAEIYRKMQIPNQEVRDYFVRTTLTTRIAEAAKPVAKRVIEQATQRLTALSAGQSRPT